MDILFGFSSVAQGLALLGILVGLCRLKTVFQTPPRKFVPTGMLDCTLALPAPSDTMPNSLQSARRPAGAQMLVVSDPLLYRETL
jgi:hypothetical protein